MTVAMPDDDLVERESELAELREALARLRDGAGVVVVVEAPAGQGKSALLRALRAEASHAGVRPLAAMGAELERDFSFGVVRQLFEGAIHARPGADRDALFDGAARLARAVFEADAVEQTSDASFARLHGLYWLAANLAEEEPLLLVVDDAHWADAPSMRFLDVLARRLEDLPIVLAIAARPSEPGAQQEVLDDLATLPGAIVLRPRSLSAGGVEALLRSKLESTLEPPFTAAAVQLTGGNPLLLRELLRTVAAERLSGRAAETEQLRAVLPANVSRIVQGRLARLPDDALAVARAVVVLGDGARYRDVEALAEVTAESVDAAHRTLARAGLLDAEELRFSHPVLRAAVDRELGGRARERWHRRAASIRRDAGAGAQELAAHLADTEPEGEAWAADALIAAGRQALLDGAPEVAARHLARALLEPPPPERRQAALLALGQAEARIGASEAVERLQAASQLDDPALAHEATRLRAQVLVLQERAPEAVEVLRDAAAAARDDELAVQLDNDLLDVMAHIATARSEYLERVEAAAAEGRPTALSHLAWVRAITAAPPVEVLDLARRALAAPAGDGRFIHYYALEALMNIEAADECAAALRNASAMAERLGSTVAAGPLTYMTSSWAAWDRVFGDLRQAEEHARYALDLMLTARAPAVVVSVRSSLSQILLDRGRHAEAEEQLALLPAREIGQGIREIHAQRARLRVFQGRYAEALEELEIEFELERQRRWAISNREASRVTWVRALLGVDRREEARAVAGAEVEVHARRGVAGAEGRARMALAATLEPDGAIEELERAAEVVRRSPVPVAQAEVIGELGSALRRAGRSSAAREPLAEAREIAHRCGATGLEERFHEELIVAGARPRRVHLSGIESLTAAERRVAELAAQGLRNREIAQSLFVTLKTVEVHLGRTYNKLGIQNRSQLADALTAAS